MTTKISELPLTGSYRTIDFIPIVDAQGTTTRRVLMSTLLTGSFGLSASFISLGTANVARTGLIRAPGGFDVWYNVNGVDRPLIQGSIAAEVIIGGNGVFDCGGIINRVSAGSTIYNQIGGSNYLTVTSTGITLGAPLNANSGVSSTGTGNELKLLHSGSTLSTFDRYLNAREDKATAVTTTGSPSKAIFTYVSGVNGKTYGVDVIVTAQSTTTTGSLFAKYTGHYYMTGGVIGVVDAPYAILESTNHTYLTASLTSSAGNIIVSGTQGASAESFRWGCFVRFQEQGGT